MHHQHSGTLLFLAVIIVSASFLTTDVYGQSDRKAIDLAVLAAPEHLRADATVMTYNSAGELSVARQGSNEMICLGDKPGDDRFQSACYHDSLEPFMARGRELKAQGKNGSESQEIRHAEADAGTLKLPEKPAMLYNLMADLEGFDPDYAKVSIYAIYIPYATPKSTGLTEKPSAPGAPWIMRSGTASAHIMVIPPGEHEH